MNEKIFAVQYPAGQKLNYSQGQIVKKIDNYFIYDIGTLGGSSGSPIILFDKLKLIALHKGCIYDKKDNNKINLGIPINLIINSIFNEIKCIYNIIDKNKEIKILDEKYKKYVEIKINGKIKKDIFSNIFNKKGQNEVYIN